MRTRRLPDVVDGSRSFLTEDQVVAAVCDMLEASGYEIRRRATMVQRGFDIVADGSAGALIIEAKGEGSSRLGSKRFGKTFDSRQARNHVGNALLKALRVASAGNARAAIAVPETAYHRCEVGQVQEALTRIGIGVFWVDPVDAAVTLDAPWQL